MVYAHKFKLYTYIFVGVHQTAMQLMPHTHTQTSYIQCHATFIDTYMCTAEQRCMGMAGRIPI